MNLMDCMMDEFADEAKVKAMKDHDVFSWLEVGHLFNIQIPNQTVVKWTSGAINSIFCN